MPVYSILNKETHETFEVNIKFADLEAYFSDNPTHKQIFNRFPSTGDSARMGLKKPDDGFRDVLRNVKSHHMKNEINDW